MSEAQTKQTHRVQEAALECTFSSPKMDPSPLLQHSISPSLYSFVVSKEPLLPTYPSTTPTRAAAQTPPSQGWDQEGNIRRGIESKKSEEHQDQTESHVLVPPPNFMPLLHPPLPQKHQ